jgi:hypothetical protein
MLTSVIVVKEEEEEVSSSQEMDRLVKQLKEEEEVINRKRRRLHELQHQKMEKKEQFQPVLNLLCNNSSIDRIELAKFLMKK